MYRCQYNLPGEGATSTKQLLQLLEQNLHAPISLAYFDDKHGEMHKLLCCYMLYGDGSYDCNTLLNFTVPLSFEQVKESFSGAGEIRRLFVEKDMVFSFDEAG
jgi:hypothetical protein